MKISEDEVRYVADLANLRLTDDELRRFRADLDEILVHIDKLNELDTSGVLPMAQVLYESEENATLRKPCSLQICLTNESALQNAPQKAAGYFKVPKVVER